LDKAIDQPFTATIKTSGGGYWSFKFLNYTELRFLNSEIGEEFS
jgi:hypothetical protein